MESDGPARVQEDVGAVATTAVNDAQLSGRRLEAAREGDSVALGELAVLCRDRAYQLAVHLLGSPEDARDVAQDAVVRVLGALRRFDSARPLEPWLASIVRNLVRDRWRRERVRRVEPLDETARAVVAQSGARSPEEETARSELQRLVWREVQALPRDHREVVALRDYAGLAYEAIGAVLGIPRGTVMSRLHRARARLRERVADQLHGGGSHA